jgi:hypothetical protein
MILVRIKAYNKIEHKKCELESESEGKTSACVFALVLYIELSETELV